jgi:hypothetical protein
MTELRPQIVSALAGERPRLTVVRAGGLGDTLLLMPAVELARRLAPAAQLTLVGSAWAERLLPLTERPPRLRRFDSPALTPLFGPAVSEDRSEVFAGADAAVLYTADPDGHLPRNARALCRGPVVVWPVRPDGSCHVAAHLAAALTAAPVTAGQLPAPALRVPADAAAWAGEWIARRFGTGAAPLAVHPGSGGPAKCWPPDRFAALIAAAAAPTLLIEGPADADPCRALEELLGEPAELAKVSGLDLARVGGLLTRCRALVGNDSGLTHLAAALSVPTVAVFAPTDPALWRPLGKRVRVAAPARPGGPWPSVGKVIAAVRALAPGPEPSA